MTNEPPSSGQSASTKQIARRYGVTGHRGPHKAHLLENGVNESRAVASPYDQALNARAQDPSLDLELGASYVALRVDRPHALAGHHEVVDIRSRTWDPPIVQDGQMV